MRTFTKSQKQNGFTLIELLAVIVVLGILSVIAVPRYFDYSAKAREATLRSTLGNVRSAISNFYAHSHLTTVAPVYPSLNQMQTPGVVLQDYIPANPYNGSAVIAAGTFTVPTAVTPNPAQTIVSGTPTPGYVYDSAVGKIWANTNTTGINENTW